MKLKFIAALLGLLMAIPGAVIAQNTDDQTPDQYSKPSPNVQLHTPDEQTPADSDQDSMNPMDQAPPDQGSSRPPMSEQPPLPGPNDPNAGGPSYNTPAPEENRGVARISLIHGDVSTQRGDSGSWSAAALNAPVVAGDRISTGDKARTELELDYANTLRLAEHTQANITQLTRTQIQIQLPRGMANFTVFRNSDADAEIDTPNVAIRTARRESSFRILVTADDHTEILVRKGEIEVTTPQGGTRVGQNQYITIQGTGADEQYKIGEAPARDDFDQWNTDRDNMIRNSEARRRTNGYYQGEESLDGYGSWSDVPDYGPVWRPAVPPDWAPYRDGRWVYEPYWGWTWVSYDPWGWAPYHYGRWMFVDGYWGWWPGPVWGYPFYRPIWAPAYVSFFGFGPGWGFGFGFGWGFGSIGWFALGPGDHFHPWWGRWGGGRFGEDGLRDYNRGGFAPLHAGARFSNVNLAMHDQHFRGATSVSGRGFGTGHMSPHAMTHAELQNAHFTNGRLPVGPNRESYSASNRPAAASTMHNSSENQHFFSAHGTVAQRTFNSPVNRGSENGIANRGSSENGLSENRSSSSGREIARESNPSAGGREGGGWQKFTPMAPRASSDSRGESGRQGESAGRGSAGSTENRGSYSSPRGSANEGRGYGSEGRSSRPPLNMRQPLVTPRSYGGSPYGGRVPGYGGSYGRSAPSFGGGHSAPSSHGGGMPHGGGAPRGGGASHGGGGSHGGGSHGGGGKHGR